MADEVTSAAASGGKRPGQECPASGTGTSGTNPPLGDVPVPVSRSCDGCDFYLQQDDGKGEWSGAGDCRRRAPSPVQETMQALLEALRADGSLSSANTPLKEDPTRNWTSRMAVWPSVFGSDWCGEFQPKGGKCGG